MLEQFHEEEDYSVVVPKELLRQAERTRMMFNVLLVVIAGISLLVGGIGIMNIMLATVTERTREIGIRRALGATRMRIIEQFLVETVVLTAGGGLLGVGFGLMCKPIFNGVRDLIAAFSAEYASTGCERTRTSRRSLVGWIVAWHFPGGRITVRSLSGRPGCSLGSDRSAPPRVDVPRPYGRFTEPPRWPAFGWCHRSVFPMSCLPPFRRLVDGDVLSCAHVTDGRQALQERLRSTLVRNASMSGTSYS